MPASPFNDIASQLSNSDVRDPAVQELIRDQILNAREKLQAAPSELVACLDAAATLVRSLPHLDEQPASEVRSMVMRLVDLVAQANPKELDVVAPAPLPRNPEPPPAPEPPPVEAQPRAMARPLPAPEPPEPPAAPHPARSSRTVDYSVPKLNDMMLGEVMVQLGFVGQEDVDAALKAMAEKGYKFGEALILSGAATAEDVAQGISLQRMLSQGQRRANQQVAKFDRASVLHGILLGEILVLMNRITREQLQRGLDHQRHTGSRIGEALIELGFISWEDLDEAISIQHARGGSSELNDSSTVVFLDGD